MLFRNTFTFWFSTPTRFSWKICSLLKDGLLIYFFCFLWSVNNCILQRCLGDSRDLPYMLQKKTKQNISLSLMCAYYGVSVVVFVINIFFLFHQNQWTCRKKIKLFNNNENILPVAHQFEEVLFKVVFVIFSHIGVEIDVRL